MKSLVGDSILNCITNNKLELSKYNNYKNRDSINKAKLKINSINEKKREEQIKKLNESINVQHKVQPKVQHNVQPRCNITFNQHR